ncbi:enoyl-CoA hydratase/isomerase family protein [Alteromonas lipotrueae]|uniref:enoyl-CoA hydratase/isomerase family protein n=1 Tax=Alteromonas lipotrueae TaxID=2803814 RepID=UPI001C482828|nr:enoyl-CoA hydratase/isomerase family protein [Alteromonas lipotrueae]
MSDSIVLYSLNKSGVATVCLNRAEKHNAFDDKVIVDLEMAFQRAADDPKVKLVILAAEGKSFSAGADLNWMKRMAQYDYQDNLRDAQGLASMLKTLNFLEKPTIARVQGAAFGGAVGLVSCCDFAIASEQASFSLSEVKLGLIPATISPYVIAAIGQRAARRYFLTGERFSAKEAEQLGLVTKIASHDELDSTLDQLVNQLLNNSPQALKQAKQLVFDVADKNIDDALIQDTSERIAAIRVSDEGQEGLSAFFDQRPAAWIGE